MHGMFSVGSKITHTHTQPISEDTQAPNLSLLSWSPALTAVSSPLCQTLSLRTKVWRLTPPLQPGQERQAKGRSKKVIKVKVRASDSLCHLDALFRYADTVCTKASVQWKNCMRYA